MARAIVPASAVVLEADTTEVDAQTILEESALHRRQGLAAAAQRTDTGLDRAWDRATGGLAGRPTHYPLQGGFFAGRTPSLDHRHDATDRRRFVPRRDREP